MRITNKDYKELEYTIHYLSQEIMRLTQTNAMLKAYIQEIIKSTMCSIRVILSIILDIKI